MANRMIFVVDDDRDVCETAAALIRVLGWRSRPFSSAQDCLDAALTERPDCILSDLQMPGMDGVALIGALEAAHMDVPVVIMTASYRESTAVSRVAGLAAALIQKPYGADQLQEAITRAVGESSSLHFPDPRPSL